MRVITDLDLARIRRLESTLGAEERSALRSLIDAFDDEAEIVPREGIGRDIVTVNSTVSFRDGPTGLVQRVTLAYPDEVSLPERRISIVSPVGRALLGRRVGSQAVFSTPDGGRREIRVLELHYQPESAGHPAL
jgi:regulator of nucleoside diphosphate kinase